MPSCVCLIRYILQSAEKNIFTYDAKLLSLLRTCATNNIPPQSVGAPGLYPFTVYSPSPQHPYVIFSVASYIFNARPFCPGMSGELELLLVNIFNLLFKLLMKNIRF